MSERDLLEVARRVVAAAAPGEEVEAYAVRSRETEVKAFAGDVESVSSSEVDGVGVRVIAGGKQGYAWAGSLDPDVVMETLDEARDNASFGAVDEHYGLVRPADFGGVEPPALDLWSDALLATPASEKVRIALEIEAAARASDPQIRGVEAAECSDSAIEAALVSSAGVEAASRRTVCSAYVVVMAGEGDGTQTGYGFTVGRTHDELDVAAAVEMARERAVRMLGATQPKSRRLPVILDPLITSSLLSLLASALSGESVLKGRSMFAGREGEDVAAAHITLVDDPTNPLAFGASTHDAEGVPTRRVDLIAGGVLQGFLHNAYTGRRSGAGTTGSAMRGFKSTPGVGPRALHLLPGDLDRDAIWRRAGDALYVQGVQGLHSGANPISGDFSVGAEGLLVRDGMLAEPVREVTIASTLQRMLHDIVAVGRDLTWLPGSSAGQTLLLSEMTMSGA